MTPEDASLLRALRLDGLAKATALEIIAALDAALKTIAKRLPTGAAARETFSYARLVALRGQMTKVREALAASITERLGVALDGVIETAPAAVAQEVRAALPAIDASFASVPFGQLLAVKDIPHDGFSWTRWGEKLADGTIARVESELRQSIALGETIRDTTDRLDRVAQLGRVSAERLARTALTATANRAQMAQWREPAVKRYADGWRFTAVLDSRVSLVCASLHGRIFDIEDTQAPFPPRHPNCRSSMSLVFKNGQYTRAHYAASESGEDWLRGLPKAQQLEILGPDRLRAFERGVKLGGMVTYEALAKLRNGVIFWSPASALVTRASPTDGMHAISDQR